MGDVPKRKVAPFPIELIVLHPVVMTLPAAGYGILLRLLVQFWMSDCRPLPKGDNDLTSIARAHRPTWRHHKPEIMLILSEVLPLYEQRYKAWLGRRGSILAQGEKGVKVRLARRAGVTAEAQAVAHPAFLPKADQANRAMTVRERKAGDGSGFQD